MGQIRAVLDVEQTPRSTLSATQSQRRMPGAVSKKRKISQALIKSNTKKLANRSIEYHSLPLGFQNVVLGDYLEFKYPRKSIEKVNKSYIAALKLIQFFPNPRFELLPFFEQHASKNDKEIAQLILIEIQKNKSQIKMRDAVFQNLWREIGEYLLDGNNLAKWNGAMDFTHWTEVEFFTSDRGIEQQIYRDWSLYHGPKPIYAEDFYENCFCRLLDQVNAYPDYPGHDRDSVERTMYEFRMLRSAEYYCELDESLTEQRIADLKKELADTEAECCWLIEICLPYITMQQYITLEETVAHMKLSIDILLQCPLVGGSYSPNPFELAMEQLVYLEGLTWEEARLGVINSTEFKDSCAEILYGEEGDYDFTDYEFLEQDSELFVPWIFEPFDQV